MKRAKRVTGEVLPRGEGLSAPVNASALNVLVLQYRMRAAEESLPLVLEMLKNKAREGFFEAPVSFEGLAPQQAINVLEGLRPELEKLGFRCAPIAVRYQKKWGAWSSEEVTAPALLVNWEVIA